MKQKIFKHEKKIVLRPHGLTLEMVMDRDNIEDVAVIHNIGVTERRSYQNAAVQGMNDLVQSAFVLGLLTDSNKKVWEKAIERAITLLEDSHEDLGKSSTK